jgi:cysteine synthase
MGREVLRMSEPVAVDPEVGQRFAALHRLVGNTPLLAIDFRYQGRPRVIYAKQESLNLTGSIKDRMALFIVEERLPHGALRPGKRIAEATSGNTGISFAAVGRALGHPVTIFMPDWMSAERIALIASFGADDRAGESCPGRLPRQHPPVGRARRRTIRPSSSLASFRQRRRTSWRTYRTTGPEIVVAARAGGPRAGRVRRRRRYGRHGDGRGERS